MVFHWSLSDSKSPRVSRFLLSFLADLNNAVVWMITTRPLLSMSSIPFINPSMTYQETNYTWYTSHFHIPQFFSIHLQGQGNYLSFYFLSILLCGQPGQHSSQFGKFSFFVVVVDYHKVWSSGQDYMIRLYVKIRLEFVCLIFQERCWVVHTPFVRVV